MEITRGDIVVAALPADYGKIRPAVVVQSDAFNPTHASVVICPITSFLVDAPLFRLTVRASSDNGLQVISQIMIDKMMAIKRERIGKVIGRAGAAAMREIDRALRAWLGLA